MEGSVSMIDLLACIRMGSVLYEPNDNNEYGYDIVDQCCENEGKFTHFLYAFDGDQQQ